MSDENQVPADVSDMDAEAAALALGVDKGAGVDPNSQIQETTQPASDDGADDPTPDSDEPDTAGEEGKETDGDGQPADHKGGQPKGVKRLLESRNAANNRVKELEEKVTRLESKATTKVEVDDEPDDPLPAEDKNRPITMADLERRDNLLAAQAKDAQARTNLITKMPEAEEFMELVDEMLKQHPTLTDEAALRLVAPNLFTGQNAPGNKLDVGGQARSPSKLKADTPLSKKTTAELEKEVLQMEKRGEISLQG